MKNITINILSKREHNVQIVTGFLMLQKLGGYNINISTHLDKNNMYEFTNIPLIEVIYNDKKIIYDVEDGYWDPNGMRKYIDSCDYYFKRSFSSQKNKEFFLKYQNSKIYPLGLNYFVTYEGNPYNWINSTWKSQFKPLFGKKKLSYFTPDRFEGEVVYKETDFKIVFLTRLWEPHAESTTVINSEREYINEMRIDIIRRLKTQYGIQFIGGLQDTSYAREIAPDLIMPSKYTEKDKYLSLLKSADICIGSMGLHESIGWKTAEYVAAAKAIINEKLHYSVPGDFENEKNYLEFKSSNDCIELISGLINNPIRIYEMKLNNMHYYYKYMRPDVMLKRTLDIVDKL